MTETLKFRPDGTFKIVHLTDFHWRNGDERDQRTQAFIEEVIVQETPDLIVITGDLVHKLETEDPFMLSKAP